MTFVKAVLAASLLAVSMLQIAPAKAETFNTCVGFIDSLPATISTQGVWCLKKDLATAITDGTAITIATNNVTIDCNGFKIGGLQAGTGSYANGIHADSTRQNATVRNCSVRGFFIGVFLEGSGNLVEDNRMDQNLWTGIYTTGENTLVQRNAVYDTGGLDGECCSYGIIGPADMIANTVAGVFAASTDSAVWGIYSWGNGNEIRDNRVRNLSWNGTGGYGYGIYASGQGTTIADNRISAEVANGGYGISGGTNTFCTGNTVVNFGTAYLGCTASDRNLTLPVIVM